jgi:hypothetical protein
MNPQMLTSKSMAMTFSRLAADGKATGFSRYVVYFEGWQKGWRLLIAFPERGSSLEKLARAGNSLGQGSREMANATLREILPHGFLEVASYYSLSVLSKGSQ